VPVFTPFVEADEDFTVFILKHCKIIAAVCPSTTEYRLIPLCTGADVSNCDDGVNFVHKAEVF
jgi:hypothetical protein